MKTFKSSAARFAVRFSSLFFIGALGLLTMFLTCSSRYNRPFWVAAIGLILTIFLVNAYFGKGSTSFFKNTFDTDDMFEVDRVREKVGIFLIFLFLLFLNLFSSLTVNNIFTRGDVTVLKNGEVIEGFSFVNPFNGKVSAFEPLLPARPTSTTSISWK